MLMKTHTIRKSKGTRILLFSKEFVVFLKITHPVAVSIFLDAIKKATGAVLDINQLEELQTSILASGQTTHQEYLALKWLKDGFRILDTDLVNSLKTLDMAIRGILGER